VRNFGFRAAHLRELVVTLRGPRGETLDASVGAGDGDPTPLAPGGERLVRRTGRVGASAGVYTVGVSYRSSAGELIPVPAIAGGTRSEVAVRVIATTGSGAPRWRSLGGILTSTPAVGVNADGRLEVFGRGQDDRMWRLTQTATGRDEFGGWELLPGEHTFAGGPAVVRNHWRKLELFARGRDGALWHRWQHEPDVRTSDKWSGWHHKGGGLACDPAVALNHDDRIEVLVIGTDARVHRIYQRWFDAFGAPWSGWEPIGSRRFTGRPAIERDGSGCLVAYARSADDHSLWRARQVSPSGAVGRLGGDRRRRRRSRPRPQRRRATRGLRPRHRRPDLAPVASQPGRRLERLGAARCRPGADPRRRWSSNRVHPGRWSPGGRRGRERSRGPRDRPRRRRAVLDPVPARRQRGQR
jgi:hypothetical protein